jgi:DNA-binding beta-propeller fold protein YncE
VAHPQIAVFARLADGNAERVRAIAGQATLLGRTMHGIAYDEIHDEIVVPQQFGQGVLTFAGDADGEARPKRLINGSKTQLVRPDRVAVDPANNEIYVPEASGKVLVFAREANGNVAPIRVLAGPATKINSPRAVAIDSRRNLLVIANGHGSGRGESSLVIFDRTASGNTPPKRVISALPGNGNIDLYGEGGLIFMTIRPAGPNQETNAFVGVWSIDDEGPTPARYTIGGPNGVLREPRGLGVDAKNQTVVVSDKSLNAVLTFHVPAIFKTSSTQD